MLNISHNQLHKSVDITDSKSGKRVFHKRYYKYFNQFLGAFAIIGIIILFLPWTQNITGRGNVTTLTLDQRPQTIQSPIPGRIEKWYVKEGDSVAQGDTIMKISEVKSEYFDPNLVERTGEQRDAKALSVESYQGKVKAQDARIGALVNERRLKLEQGKNKILQSKLKVQSDSIDYKAAQVNIKIAQTKYNRVDTLYKEGFAALKNVEDARVKLQETQAKLISQQTKLLAARNEVINSQVEISRIQAEYADKISKAQSDKFSAQSSQFDTEAQVTKLDNQYANYKIRNSLLFITAPYNGYINKAIRAGIGQTFKEGEDLVGIMPTKVDLAVETFVAPIDLPLIHLGEKVRVQFDGWPAIVFSGWPNVSYGTYGAKVVAVENFISPNGKFRVLLAPDEEDHAWPKDLRAGSGALSLALLEDVPIWFELWRQLNGFPPNYYQPGDGIKMSNKTKK